MAKGRLFWLLVAFLPALAKEIPPPQEREKGSSENTAQVSDCNRFPFGKGCLVFGFGPLITSDGRDIIYGVGANLNYLIVDRLALGASGGAVFGGSLQNYSLGPALTYFIGPFGDYLFTPSLSATRHFLRGRINAEGWAYGPSLGLLSRFFGRAYWGISVGYITYEVAGYKSSDWTWSPVVFVPF